jgi:Cys-tRNA(Pro)/Cys-tRNA(Cys) deacylase
MEKTNVMRILDQKKIKYNSYSYVNTDAISGMEVAAVLNQDPNRMFKTLVTVSNTNNYFVFVIPVNKDLDLKKAAKSVGVKSVSMLKQKDLLPLTGYVHGGCSPIGMKKSFLTTFDSSCNNFETIIFSAGKIGYQVEVNVNDLKGIIKLQTDDIVGE